MLYDINNNLFDIDLDYFNLDNNNITMYDNDIKYNKRDNVDLNNGFYLGNMFIDSYEPYKDKKVKKINAYSDRQKMLIKIYELEFYINDLNLYLDINPNDNDMFSLFKKCVNELNVLKKDYESKYEIFSLCSDIKDKYSWIDNPWPWDGGYYV